MQIGHKTDDADKTAQTNGHGKVNDDKSDGEHHAIAQRYKGLSAKIAAHSALDIVDELHCKGPTTARHKARPSAGNLFIIHQQEKQIKQSYERRDEADKHVGRRPDNVPNLGHSTFDGGHDIFLAQKLAQFETRGVFAEKLLDGTGDGTIVGALFDIAQRDVFQMDALFNHRWYSQIKQSAEDAAYQHQRQHDAKQAIVQPATVLQEADDGIKQISHGPCHEERHEHTAQIVDHVDDGCQPQHEQQAAHEAVEVDFFPH